MGNFFRWIGIVVTIFFLVPWTGSWVGCTLHSVGDAFEFVSQYKPVLSFRHTDAPATTTPQIRVERVPAPLVAPAPVATPVPMPTPVVAPTPEPVQIADPVQVLPASPAPPSIWDLPENQ